MAQPWRDHGATFEGCCRGVGVGWSFVKNFRTFLLLPKRRFCGGEAAEKARFLSSVFYDFLTMAAPHMIQNARDRGLYAPMERASPPQGAERPNRRERSDQANPTHSEKPREKRTAAKRGAHRRGAAQAASRPNARRAAADTRTNRRCVRSDPEMESPRAGADDRTKSRPRAQRRTTHRPRDGPRSRDTRPRRMGRASEHEGKRREEGGRGFGPARGLSISGAAFGNLNLCAKC